MVGSGPAAGGEEGRACRHSRHTSLGGLPGPALPAHCLLLLSGWAGEIPEDFLQR